MGLTGGFADVGGLYDCFYGIYTGQADDSILDKYDEIRREKYWSVIDPISSGNIQRLWDPSPEAIENDELFNLLKKAEADKTGNMSREMALVSLIAACQRRCWTWLDMADFQTQGANNVMHDFTQYYNKAAAKT